MDKEKEKEGEQTTPVSSTPADASDAPTGPCASGPASDNFSKLQVEFRGVTPKSADQGKIDSQVQLVQQNGIESDRDYRKITQSIIDITKTQLEEHNKDKKPIRSNLLNFVRNLLVLQFAALVIFILTNSAYELGISDEVLRTFIVSVFVETLAGLIIMIKYAFDSKQEVELIKILNDIITHFKKYEEK